MIGLISKMYMPMIEDDIKRVRISSGDQIVIKLKNDKELNLTIGRDQRGNTFAVFSNLLTEFHHMNRTNTNRGGWRDCDMRKYAKEFEKLLPDSFLDIIKPYHIVQQIGDSKIECDDNVFCMSMTQIFGKRSWWANVDPEDSRLDIFKKPIGRVRTFGEDGDPDYWWTRSPNVSNTTSFGFVYTTGSDTTTTTPATRMAFASASVLILNLTTRTTMNRRLNVSGSLGLIVQAVRTPVS